MSENVGAIEYYIDADTQGLLTAEKMVDKSTKRMESDFDRTGKSVDKLNTRMSKTAQGVNKSMGGMGRSAGQAGIQIQQLVGQIQGGQNAMAALSMQAADIGIVMGAPLLGAVAGLAAAFGGALVPSLFDSKDATEELEEALKRLGDAVEIEDGVARLTKEIRELAKESKTAAMAQLAQEAVDARNLIMVAAEGIDEAINEDIDIDKAIAGFRRYQSAIEAGGARAEASLAIVEGRVATQDKQYIDLQSTIRGLNRELGLSFEQSVAFLDAINRVKTDGTAENIQNLQNVLGDLNGQFNQSNEPLLALQANMSKFFSEARTGAEMIKAVDKFMGEFDESLVTSDESATKASESINKLVGSLQHQAATAGMTQRQMAIYSATMMAAQNPAIDLAAAIDKINAAFDRIEAAEKLSANMKSLESASAQAEKEFQSLVTQWQSGMMALEDTETQRETFIDDLWEQGVSAGKTREQIQRLADGYRELWAAQDEAADNKKAQQRLEQTLQELRNAQLQRDMPSDEFEVQMGINALGDGATDEMKKQVADAIRQMQDLRFQAQLTGQSLEEAFKSSTIDAVGSLSDGLANVIMNGGSAEEVLKNVARTMVQQLISAMLQAAVIAPLIAWMFPGAAASMSAATAAVTAATSSLGAAATGGGRLYGGNVENGKLYPVTENGRPELLTQGNKQYLLPGDNGRVTSNRDMTRNMTNNESNNINLSLNMSPNSPDEFRRQLFDNRESIYNLVKQALNDRGRKF